MQLIEFRDGAGAYCRMLVEGLVEFKSPIMGRNYFQSALFKTHPSDLRSYKLQYYPQFFNQTHGIGKVLIGGDGFRSTDEDPSCIYSCDVLIDDALVATKFRYERITQDVKSGLYTVEGICQ